MLRSGLALTILAASTMAHAGVISGAASDGKAVAKVASYPARHPKASAKGLYKGVKGAGKGIKAVAKGISKV